MSIEILIVAIIVIAVVAYFLFKDSKDETPTEPTLKADKTEAEASLLSLSDIDIARKEPAKTVKKTTTKKASKVDLDSMNKTELLAYAKANGIKANASLKKEEVLDRIKNG